MRVKIEYLMVGYFIFTFVYFVFYPYFVIR
jgi:hypothetical protein